MKVLVGSENPVKIAATKEAFSKYFDDVNVLGIKVGSNVSEQPVNEETLEGARNRALKLKKIDKNNNLEADFFVGLEGGIIKIHSKWFVSNSIFIINKENKEGFGSYPLFELPKRLSKELLETNKELGDIMERLEGDTNVKQKGGAAGFFTKRKINRKEFYIIHLVSSLVPFIHKELFEE